MHVRVLGAAAGPGNKLFGRAFRGLGLTRARSLGGSGWLWGQDGPPRAPRTRWDPNRPLY